MDLLLTLLKRGKLASFAMVGLFPLLFLGLTACQDSRQDDSDLSAITNRSQREEPFAIALVKLQTPPLLATARLNELGLPVVDDTLKEKVLAEQAAIIAELQQVSAEIKVIYRYRFVLNALSLLVPTPLLSKIQALPGVLTVKNSLSFSRPKPLQHSDNPSRINFDRNSVNFIEADRVHSELQVLDEQGQLQSIDGRGIRVGIIDTGIDYTHAMFGGTGRPEDYQANDHTEIEARSFPTDKVVGGIDLVGSDYNDSAIDFNRRIPRPNADPLDESGHGTHVAGTVAGLGDGVHTYSGVAPGAKLYAIKVFGREGSTSDHVIIAALEYAVDPNADLNPDDRLDIVNLSLGSSFGLPHVLYDEAIKNLVQAGVTPVMSAGNAGEVPYIVGSPGAAAEAISVAAAIDHNEANWKFRAVRFVTPHNPNLLVKAFEANFTRPIAEAGMVSGPLLPIGLADQELSEAVKQELAGKVALIDRGVVTFAEKLERASQAGAIGVVVINNVLGEPFPMAGEGDYPIPAIMIEQSLGEGFKQAIAAGHQVSIDFQTDEKVEEPDLIDTLTSFSSRGPRSLDSFIKPELAAPGQNIVSAKLGSGHEGVALSGTSMAAPHIAGVVALLKQYRKNLSEDQVKAILLSTAKPMEDRQGEPYSVAYQGAGRVQAYKALTSSLAVNPATLSLGELGLERQKTVKRSIRVHNLADQSLSLQVTASLGQGLTVEHPTELQLNPGEAKEVPLLITLSAPSQDEIAKELFGHVYFRSPDQAVEAKLTVLGVSAKMSRIQARQLKVYSASADDAPGAVASLELINQGATPGFAYLFNLFAKDKRKEGVGPYHRLSDICDLESVGYRIVDKEVEGEAVPMLQVAAKLYSPLTNWNHCEISLQIDGNGDGQADQELLGTDMKNLTEQVPTGTFVSVLTDAEEMRRLRKAYEDGGEEDYYEAVIDVQPLQAYEHSTLMVLEARLDKLARTSLGQLRVKVASLVATNVINVADDFLQDQETAWKIIDPVAEAGAFYQLPEKVELQAGEKKEVQFVKGQAGNALIAYFPHNKTSNSVLQKGKQSQLLRAQFQY